MLYVLCADRLASPRSPQQAERPPGLDAIFLTHAHIGHYTGLMYLGREVVGARALPTFCMPQLRQFLEGNGPWDLLVRLKNLELTTITPNKVGGGSCSPMKMIRARAGQGGRAPTLTGGRVARRRGAR